MTIVRLSTHREADVEFSDHPLINRIIAYYLRLPKINLKKIDNNFPPCNGVCNFFVLVKDSKVSLLVVPSTQIFITNDVLVNPDVCTHFPAYAMPKK